MREIYIKVPNDFLRKSDSKYYFDPNNNGKLDFLVYVTVSNIKNARGQFEITVNRLVEHMSFKPNTRAGKINEQCLESLKRLQSKGLLELYEFDKKIVSGVIMEHEYNNGFFKLDMDNVQKILGDPICKLTNDDNYSKYNDKSSSLYTYAYIISMMKVHPTTEPTINFYGCYPSMENITSNCDISESYLRKILSYFEEDELIFSINLGRVTGEFGSVMSNNYYTNNIEYLNAGYIFAKAYCDMYNIKYSYDSTRIKNALDEISEINEEVKEVLEEYDKKELIKFKEHLKLIKNSTIEKAYSISPNLNKDSLGKNLITGKYKNSKLYDESKPRDKYFIYIGDDDRVGVSIVHHFRNRLRYLVNLYEIKEIKRKLIKENRITCK